MSELKEKDCQKIKIKIPVRFWLEIIDSNQLHLMAVRYAVLFRNFCYILLKGTIIQLRLCILNAAKVCSRYSGKPPKKHAGQNEVNILTSKNSRQILETYNEAAPNHIIIKPCNAKR